MLVQDIAEVDMLHQIIHKLRGVLRDSEPMQLNINGNDWEE